MMSGLRTMAPPALRRARTANRMKPGYVPLGRDRAVEVEEGQVHRVWKQSLTEYAEANVSDLVV
jgi:hypothetical protein